MNNQDTSRPTRLVQRYHEYLTMCKEDPRRPQFYKYMLELAQGGNHFVVECPYTILPEHMVEGTMVVVVDHTFRRVHSVEVAEPVTP